MYLLRDLDKAPLGKSGDGSRKATADLVRLPVLRLAIPLPPPTRNNVNQFRISPAFGRHTAARLSRPIYHRCSVSAPHLWPAFSFGRYCYERTSTPTPVPVRHPQGSAHGFVALKTLKGTRIATGDMTQIVHGDRVTSRLIFRFRDGSIDDDITVFSQRGVFRLITDHHTQRGPWFPKPTDVFINALTGQITSHTQDGKMRQDHLDLPPDVSNGLPPNLLMNILPSTPETKLSFVAPSEKPRLIRVSIKSAGEVPFTIGGTKRKAIDFVLHPELGGVTGMIAPLVGKQPPDYHIWILLAPRPRSFAKKARSTRGAPPGASNKSAPNSLTSAGSLVPDAGRGAMVLP